MAESPGFTGLGAPFLPGFPVSPLPGQCINSQPWLPALTHCVAPLMRGHPGRRRRRDRATGLSPVGPPWAGAEAALPRGLGVAQCATTALAGAVPRPYVRGARGRFRGLGLVPGVVSPPFPPPRPACPALRVTGRPVWVSLTLARWYAIPRGLCVPQARSGCPSGSPRVPFSCVCARAPAVSAPAHPSTRSVPLRVSCPGPLLRLACLGGGGLVPVPPYLAWPARPAGAACRRGGEGPSPEGWSATVPSPNRPSSGAGSRGTATRVFRVRSVWAWGPNTDSTVCALAGRRCSLSGWRKGVPGGGAFHCCEGRLRTGAPPPPTAHPLGGLLGSVTHMLRARACGCGGPSLPLWPACPVGAACRGGGGGLSPGQVACHRCEGRLVSGAVPPPAACPLGWAAGVPRPVCPGCGRCGRGDPAPAPQLAPLRAGVARCGGGVGLPRGGAFHRCEGRLRSGAPPPLTARLLGGLLGSATHVLWARACGCGGPTMSPWRACPVGAACSGGGGGPSPGGGSACHRCEGRLVSGAVPPPTARPLWRAARSPRSVCSRCGRCGRGDPAPVPQHAPLRAGVARCGGGGRASPGGVPSTVVRGV